MNGVCVHVQVSRAGANGISFQMTRVGDGDDMVEAHVAYLQAVLAGAVSGLRELKGSPEPPDPSEAWKKG